jgi:hypothetical protein
MPARGLIPGLAILGSVLILAVMVVPTSPAVLSWPREVIILVLFVTAGLVFWIGGKRTRSVISEKQRAYLILERFADHATTETDFNHGQKAKKS